MAKILYAEDDAQAASGVTKVLEHERHVVEHVDNGDEARDRLRTYQYDLIILDWQLPGTTGLDLCKGFRARGGQTPVLMLTGKQTIVDKEAGFGAGADDYLTKPFNLRELLVRVQALLRRPAVIASEVLQAGGISLDVKAFRVSKDGHDVHIMPRDFAVLQYLMRHENQVLSSEQLLNAVWPNDSEATSDALRQCIRRLRSKLDVDGKPSVISTLPGAGYRFDGKPS